MADIHNRTFSAGEVIAAANIPMSTLQNWIKRGVIIGHRKIEGGGEKGKHRRFTWFNVMEIATAAALVKAGVSDLSVVFKAGMEFGHTGPGPLPGSPEREPGVPHNTEHGRTLLFLSGEHSEVVCWKPGKDVLASVRVSLRQPQAFIVVDLLDMFNHACAALDLHPQAVMDAAYGCGDGHG